MTEERILDFLDGNLGASEEEELLHRLAVSPERRSLLKQHLQMRDLTASLARNAHVSVPKVVTASLFTALAANGYAGPRMPQAAESLEAIKASQFRNVEKAAQNIVAKRTPVFFRRSSLIFASIASFILGAAVLYSIMPEARQDKFASSISNILNGKQSTTIISEIAAPVIHSSVNNIGTSTNSNAISHDNINTVQNIISKKKDINISSNPTNISEIGNNSMSITPNVIQSTDAIAAISNSDVKYPEAIAETSDIHGRNLTSVNPFDPIEASPVSERSFLQRLTVSLRSGEGKAPGNTQALTGSLIEIKASYDINDFLVAKISIGDFMPYETQAVTANPAFNSDGFRLLQLSPVMQYRAILSAEIGAKFNMFNAPFELTGGIISDLQGNIIPRAGFFTSLSLQDNLSMNIGLEGMIYSHDIRPSLLNAQALYAGEHPSLIGQIQNKETTGFIGPAIELVWHL